MSEITLDHQVLHYHRGDGDEQDRRFHRQHRIGDHLVERQDQVGEASELISAPIDHIPEVVVK